MSKILNFGSINIDHVYKVPHFVQEGETLSSLSLEIFPGGKGLNQSISLAKAGAQVYHAGKIGPDGLDMLELMKTNGINIDHVLTSGSNTGTAMIQVDTKGKNCILLHAGANCEIDQAQISASFAEFTSSDILLVQNETNVIEELLYEAKRKGIPVALNPSPIDDKLTSLQLESVRWFLLNEIEAMAITGCEKPQEALRAMSEKYPDSAIILTLGKQGVLYHYKNETLKHGIYNVPVVDSTAAGDTFVGFFIAAIQSGKRAEEALRIASIASSITVSRPGAAVSIPTYDEVLRSNLEPI